MTAKKQDQIDQTTPPPAQLPALRQPSKLAPLGCYDIVPQTIAAEGEKSSYRFIEFFTANIRNPKTRQAYYRNSLAFFQWAESNGLSLKDVTSVHVASYVELLGKRYSVPTVKQNLATIRMLFDWMLLGQIVASNPAHAVRGPKHVINRGKTPILDEESAQKLLGAINTKSLVGLRDKALIAVMVYLFARIDAALKTNFDDYYAEGKRWRLRLHEKNAKDVSKPVPHKLEAILDAYIEAAGLSGKSTPLFQSTRGRSGVLTGRRMSPSDAWRMVQRRAKDAEIETHICCHTFRGTGITNYLENGGSVEKAAEMANHSSIRTTKLYDRRNDEPTLEEFERISI